MIAGTIPGCLFIAWINNRLYGSPLASGYGSLSALFSLSYIPINIERYGVWLVRKPDAARRRRHRRAARAAEMRSGRRASSVRPRGSSGHASLWCGRSTSSTCHSKPGGSSGSSFPRGRRCASARPPLLVRIAQSRRVSGRVVACAILAAVGAHNLYYASTHGAFPSGEGDHRYVSIAKMVEQATDPSAVIFTGQHSGPIRYYAGRTIVRFDMLDRAWLDRAVQWLNSQGRRPYFLLEEWEVTEFQERFARPRTRSARSRSRRSSTTGRLACRAASISSIPRAPKATRSSRRRRASAHAKCVPPSPLLHLR